MTENDMIILCSGTKNTRKNETYKGLRCTSQFIGGGEGEKDTKVIIIEAPHRVELVPKSCVNKEVVSFNRRLQNIIKSFNHVEIVNMNLK